ncbi:SGNH/GDSL hydrolase family protein [Kribbella swartbergensis]
MRKRLSSIRPSRRLLFTAGTAAAASTVASAATASAGSVGELASTGAYGSGTLGAWERQARAISSEAQIRKARENDGVYMFGDSIGVQDGPALAKQLAAHGITMAVHNWAGRPVTPAVDALDTWAQDYGLPHRILMSVGSNDIFTPPAVAAQVERTMQIVGPERTVFWVNIQAARTAHGPAVQVSDQRNSAWINLQLAEAQRRHENLRIIHWAEHLAAQPNRLSRYLRDGLHPSVPLGQNARNALIVQALKSG